MANAGPVGGLALSATGNLPGEGGLGTVEAGTLELSNVDLTEQFANMITTQRSFQASSRIVTVSDQVLEEVVNLKR
jgi:flagellar hook protein FlgE